MDFDIPEDLRLLQETVRRFVDRELIPLEGNCIDGPDLKPDIERHLTASLQGNWPLASRCSGAIGGQGLGLLARAIIWEEFGRTVALPPRGVRILGPEVRPVLYVLEGEMRELYLFPVMRGEKESLLRANRARCRLRPRLRCAPPLFSTATTM